MTIEDVKAGRIKNTPPFVIAYCDNQRERVDVWSKDEWMTIRPGSPAQLEDARHYATRELARNALKRIRSKFNRWGGDRVKYARVYSIWELIQMSHIDTELMLYVQENY